MSTATPALRTKLKFTNLRKGLGGFAPAHKNAMLAEVVSGGSAPPALNSGLELLVLAHNTIRYRTVDEGNVN